MRKILIYISVFLVCLVSCSKKVEQITFLGCHLVDVNDNEYSQDFIFDKIDSKTLYKLIDNDVKNEETKNHISSILKQSKTAFICVGLFDLMKNVKLDNGELSFEFKKSIIELYELNLVNIIDCLFDYQKDIKINIFSIYNPYEKRDSFFYQDYNLGVNRFNEVIERTCLENNCNYLDITFLSNHLVEYNQFDEEAKTQLKELIIKYE